ncbi:MAG: septum formation initiator family protein [Ktedonobacteraceae bacterium]|nr:septum formation initiator family protein [Ktedonobacteraceae bacterium]
MQDNSRKPRFSSRPGNSSANVTSAVGMGETVGRLRARRTSLFTQTVMWITGLVCVAFLFGSLAQAWSNSQLMQQVQNENKKLQQIQAQHTQLVQAADHFKDPAVIENEARQQLGYIRPGEQPVVIVGSNQQGQQNTQPPQKKASPPGFWQEWWKIFFGE